MPGPQLTSVPTVSAARGSSWRTLGFSCLAIFICLAILEGILRLSGLHPPPMPYDNNRADILRGMIPEPSQRWKAFFPEYPGTLYMQTNNRGFYEEQDTPLQKTPGQIRIAVVGDSQTVGSCAANENFPNVLQRQLNARGGARCEVLNAGVGRYSPYQYYVRAKHDIVPLKPDYLLTALYLGNDFLDLIRRDDRPWLRREADGAFSVHRPDFVVYSDPSAGPSVFESSRLYQFGKAALSPTLLYQISRVKLLMLNIAAAGHGTSDMARYMNEVRKLDGHGHGLMLQSLHQYVWFQHFPETLPAALAINRETMRLMKELCDQNGIKLEYVLIPTKTDIEPAELESTFMNIHADDPAITLAKLRDFENTLAENAIASATELGVRIIDLRSELRNRGSGQTLYYPQDLHLNVNGNRVVASALCDLLAPELKI